MTASISGSAVGARSTTSPATVSYTAASGRFLVLLASRESATATLAGVSDDGGNTWNLQASAPVTETYGRRVEIWTCVVSTGLTTISAAFSGNSPTYTGVYDIINVDSIDSSSASAHQNPGSGVVTTPGESVTPSTGTDLVLSMIMENGSGTQTYAASTGWTMLTPSTGSVPGGYGAAYMMNPPEGAPVAPTWTVASNAGYSVGSIALKSTEAGPSYTVSVWDGSAEQSATLEGVWTGSEVLAATLDTIL